MSQKTQDLTIAETPVLLARSGTKVCFADTTQYSLLDIETKETMSLIPFDTANEKARSRPQHIGPQIKVINNGEFLLSTTTAESNTFWLFFNLIFLKCSLVAFFIFQTAAWASLFPHKETQFGGPFSGLPFQPVLVSDPNLKWCGHDFDLSFPPAGYKNPYVLALQKGGVEVHSILDQKLQQTIDIPNDEPRHMSNQKDKFYIATKSHVFLLLWTPIDAQVTFSLCWFAPFLRFFNLEYFVVVV